MISTDQLHSYHGGDWRVTSRQILFNYHLYWYSSSFVCLPSKYSYSKIIADVANNPIIP